jgi:hypothetical protein
MAEEGKFRRQAAYILSSSNMLRLLFGRAASGQQSLDGRNHYALDLAALTLGWEAMSLGAAQAGRNQIRRAPEYRV